MTRMNKRNGMIKLLLYLLVITLLSGCGQQSFDKNQNMQKGKVEISDDQKTSEEENEDSQRSSEKEDEDSRRSSEKEDESDVCDQITSISQLSEMPEYSGYASVEINGNKPFFSLSDKKRKKAFEKYSKLDSLDRCGTAYANICKETQPDEERGTIGSVKPSGWHTVKYNDIIDGNYLYNRCHLIGYQLSGENANEKNLITGTRYLNVVGMLPFENEVDDYVDSTGNHVLYRATPYFQDENLVASGVLMEAWSVEDHGKGICFNVYCYNVQPGVEIDYSNGESKRNEDIVAKDVQSVQADEQDLQKNESDTSSTASTSAEKSAKVWISASGTKYHSRNDCGRMNPNTATKISEDDAKSKGLSKCKKCW